MKIKAAQPLRVWGHGLAVGWLAQSWRLPVRIHPARDRAWRTGSAHSPPGIGGSAGRAPQSWRASFPLSAKRTRRGAPRIQVCQEPLAAAKRFHCGSAREIIEKRRGFTLIELLVVIAIIGILAAMLLPAISRAKVHAQEAVAKTDINNLVGAISSYKADYSVFPTSDKATKSANPDFTYGTMNYDTRAGQYRVLKTDKGQPLPLISSNPNGYQNSNAEVVSILRDLDYFRDGGKVPWNQNHKKNTKKINYLNVKDKSGLEAGGVGVDGVYRDPWGDPYIITLDLNYDGQCLDAFYRLTSVSHDPTGSASQGFNGLFNRDPGKPNNFALQSQVMIWSFGADRRVNPNQSAPTGVNKDNVTSW